MTDHLPDAPVSPERLDELIRRLDDDLTVMRNKECGDGTEWAAGEEADIQDALGELKAMRQQCERQRVSYWTDVEMNLRNRADITETDKAAMKAVIKALFDNKRSPSSEGDSP